MKKSHTPEQRTFALDTLRSNNLNFTKNQRETGITKNTLVKWYNAEQKPKENIPPAPEQIDPEIVKEILLKRIYQLAGITTDIEKIVKALNVISQNYPAKNDDKTPDLFDIIDRMMEEGGEEEKENTYSVHP